MSQPKSPVLRSLLRAIRKAALVNRYPGLDPQTAVQLSQTDEWTRRKFLRELTRTAATVGIASTLPPAVFGRGGAGQSLLEVPAGLKRTPSIAIVGAGIAGLHCAYVLKKMGVTAQIYEGDKRAGGRMYSRHDEFGPGLTTEFGAEFIDTNHEDMLNLAKEFGLKLLDNKPDFDTGKVVKDVYRFDERFYTEEELIEEFRKVVPQLEKDRASCGENYDTPACEKLDRTSLEEYVRRLYCSKWVQDLLIGAYLAEFGLEAAEQSALNLIDLIGLDTSHGFQVFGDSDERFKIVGGNQRITDELYERLKDQVHFEHRLTALRQERKSYTLVFEGQQEVKADIVVLTLPFTILRSIDLQLKKMPAAKRRSIDELGYGANNKLILGLKARPWRTVDPPKAGFIYTDTINNGWDSGHMQNGNSGPTGFTIFLGGKTSLEVAQTARELRKREEVADRYVQYFLGELDKALPGTKEQFLGMHKAALWTNNPFVQASYACYRPGQWTDISGWEMEPVGRVYFAGEHCSDAFQGYMNGGAETGRQVAETIAHKYKLAR
ncbi:MAG: FAD-dependent oxidoreductase [Saprospiraceae bacterium]|nr:FAD-dependent oxidoreductase [Saprospiraceae bacterium]